MPLWEPTQFWSGEDVFIVGGGPSLNGFDFSRVRNKNVIGCNTAALRLGSDICDICFFADVVWFLDNFRLLSEFQGLIVTHCQSMLFRSETWLRVMERQEDGLHKDSIGFGGNSGASALNLALILGAKRVFLLGMDCVSTQKQENNTIELDHHWHADTRQLPTDGLYRKFKDGFGRMSIDLPRVFPGTEVFNLNPLSSLRCFPFMTADAAIDNTNALGLARIA